MDIVLDSIAIGPVPDAAAKAGVKEGTIYQWKLRYPEFRRNFEYVMANRGKAKGFRPFDAEFRKEYFHLDTPWHLQEAMNLINDLKGGEWGLILMPPNHAKSAISEDWFSHGIAMDANTRDALVSKTQGHAKKELGKLKERMTNRYTFSDFINDYGPFRADDAGRPWTSEYVTVALKDSDERDYTVQALGVKGQMYGARYNRVLLDDIADTENQTAAEIEKQLEWIQLIVDSRLDPDNGIGLVVGTRIREADIYGALLDLGWFDKVLILPAISNDNKPLWPERWPMEKLLKKRNRTDPRIWALSYQQDPLPSEGAIFPMEAVSNCFNPNRQVGQIPEGCVVVVGIDPAPVNYTAGVVMAVNPKTKMRYLIDVWNEKGLTGDGGDILAGINQFIFELCKMYRASIVCIEVNNVQAIIAKSLSLRASLADIGCRIMTHQSGRGENDDMEITQLSGLFTNGLVDIPYQGASKQRLKDFVHQFVVWRPADKHLTRDIVKAFQFAEKAARDIMAAHQHKVERTRPLSPSMLRRIREVPVHEPV